MDTGCLAARGDVVAFTAGDGPVYVSSDRARSGTWWADELPSVTCVGLAQS